MRSVSHNWPTVDPGLLDLDDAYLRAHFLGHVRGEDLAGPMTLAELAEFTAWVSELVELDEFLTVPPEVATAIPATDEEYLDWLGYNTFGPEIFAAYLDAPH